MILETNKHAPIGIFDSGVGGLTAVRCLRRLLPGEDIVFFGDTARVPYGSRTPEEIHRFARENLDLLLSFGAKAVLAACGTISAIALEDLQDAGIPVCGVLLPAVEKAAKITRSGRVGVIATPASIGSGSYQRALEARGCTVAANACPRYVPLAEQGRVQPGDPAVEEATAEYLAPIRAAEVDTLILGCTHFPLFREVISAYLGEGVTLVDASSAAAEALAGMTGGGDRREGGRLEIWVSGDPVPFTPLAERFLQEKNLRVRKVPQAREKGTT